MMELISFGYMLNFGAMLFNFFNMLFASHRGDRHLMMAKMDYLGTISTIHRMKTPFKLQYSILLPFGYAYWFFAFHFSYLKFEGDIFDKLINYYTHN